MTTEIATRLENFVLTFGLTLARANSDWTEAETLLAKGKDSKRAVGKENLGSRRVVPHGIDASTVEGKKKVAAFKAAAGTLNAADVILTDDMQKELESLRLALRKTEKAPASK